MQFGQQPNRGRDQHFSGPLDVACADGFILAFGVGGAIGNVA